MVRASSIIDVAIIGDAKKLVGATKSADKALGGLLGSATKLLGAGLAIDAGFDFVNGALDNADALADATTRLEGTLGKVDAKPLEDIAGSMTKIGLSKIDFTQLAADLAEFGHATGITNAQVVSLTGGVVDAAVAFSATDASGRDAATVLELMEKAAAGSGKAAKELGVTLIDGADAATQMANISAQLTARLGSAGDQMNDLHGKQKQLGAQWDNFTTSVGQALEGPLTDLLTFINDEIAAIPHAIEGFQKLGRVIQTTAEDALAPLARVNDALGDLGDLIGGIFGSDGTAKLRVQVSESIVTDEIQRYRDRNGQGRP